MPIMSIAPDQFHIRLMSADDADAYFELLDRNRKFLEEYFPVTVALTHSREDTINYITNSLYKIERKEFYPFLILAKKENTIIGSIFVKSIEWNIPKAELAYFIDHQMAGNGIITAALSQVITYCFHELLIRKLLIKTHETNFRSRRVAEKNGFQVEGTIRYDHKTTDGRLLDMLYYGLVR